MANVKRSLNHSRVIPNDKKPFWHNLKWMLIALLCAKVLFAQYSNATLNGPWFLYTQSRVLNVDSLGYLVFDGNGNIIDGNMFQFVTSHYSVTASGVITGTIMGAYPFSAQLISPNVATMGPMTLKRISNPGALTDSLIGVVTSDLCSATKNIVLRLNNQGQIISASGLTSPVSGRVYADSGVFIGHLKTGDQGCYSGSNWVGSWDEFTIIGTYSNDSLNGGIGIDGPQDSNRDSGATHLVRKGIVTFILKQRRTVSESRQIICRNNGAGMFSISMRNAVTGTMQIQVMDLLGRNVAAEQITHAFGNYSAQVDLSKLSKGIYFIQVQSNKTIYRNKILIE